MTLDDILDGLFGAEREIEKTGALLYGFGTCGATRVGVIGVTGGEPLGVDGVLPLAAHVLDVVAKGGETPIVVLVDTEGQRMSRHDELLGLNEYLAHLAKCLLLASLEGHRTIGIEYGKAAAGAFLATALACDVLVALPGAEPAVMDLPSMARVTKLPKSKLEELAKTTSIFAPGLDHLFKTGAVAEVWDAEQSLSRQFEATLSRASAKDERDTCGAERKGRLLAASVAQKVIAQAVDGKAANAAAA